jgi:predicted PurR-regulated permease PerM
MRLKSFESRAFLALVLLITATFFWMVRRFLMPVFWAAVLAALFRPVYFGWLRVVRGRASIAAALTTLSVVFVVLIPLVLLGAAVTQQAVGLYQRIAAGDVNLHAPIDFVERSLPALNALLVEYGIDAAQVRASIESAAVSASQFIALQAVAIGQGTLTFLVLFALMLYFLFFFVRDGDRLMKVIIHALPLGDERERRLFAKLVEVSRATLKGTLVVAAVQGALGGILFAMVGIGASVFWGVVMGVLSLLPAVGPALVWLPAAIYLLATGSVWSGIFVIAGGTLVVGLVDNILRPILVGRDTKMPDYLVLLSTLGGLAVFGIQGVVVGPVIASLFLVVWEMFAEEYSPLDSSLPAVEPVPPPDPTPPATEAPASDPGLPAHP